MLGRKNEEGITFYQSRPESPPIPENARKTRRPTRKRIEYFEIVVNNIPEDGARTLPATVRLLLDQLNDMYADEKFDMHHLHSELSLGGKTRNIFLETIRIISGYNGSTITPLDAVI